MHKQNIKMRWDGTVNSERGRGSKSLKKRKSINKYKLSLPHIPKQLELEELELEEPELEELELEELELEELELEETELEELELEKLELES